VKPPDWKITGAAGFVVGLAISGLVLVSPPGRDLAVQTIELQDGQAEATPGPILVVVDGLATPAPSGDVPASPTRSLDPAPQSTPAVVAPPVVSERPTATPRPTPRATPKPTRSE
jgi:hypothetical protein